MMQETGKTNISCGKILSIQSQLGGLSFYSLTDKKYSFRQIKSDDEIVAVTEKELLGEDYDGINFYHNTTDYVMIPTPLFDENMSDAYLLAKDITIADDEIITVTATDELVFISTIKRDVYTQFTKLVPSFNLLPIVAKSYSFCKNYDFDILSYVIEDKLLHISYGEKKMIRFCETLPLTSSSDFEFFIETIIKKFKPNKNFKVISLYENGEFAVSQKVIAKYQIMKILNENYFEIGI